MQQLIEETEKADDDKKKKLVEDSGLTGRHGKWDWLWVMLDVFAT